MPTAIIYRIAAPIATMRWQADLMINVRWGNRLEDLAAAMFAEMDAERAANPSEVLSRRQCVLVPNRIVAHWLRHQYLFRDAPARVLANYDFPLVNVFVNDRLFRLSDPAAARRDPAAHPFGREALTWRLFAALASPLLDEPAFRPLRDYLQDADTGPDAQRRLERRRLKLAGRLATLFDEYMVYRPDTLLSWERGESDVPDAGLSWQPALWRALTAGGLASQTYLADFRRIARDLPNCGVAADYRRLRLFGVALLPCVYLHFFERLSELLPVDFYALNPCAQDWFVAPGAEQRRATLLQGRLDDETELFDPGNAFLGTQGRGNRNFLVELLDRTDGQAEAEGLFTPPGRDTLLQALQQALLDNARDAADAAEFAESQLPPARRSVQIHVCHGARREVEVLRDHLLRWFTEEPGLQPRHVQVQVSDLALYAPYIHAVFATPARQAPEAIPYAIADRVAASESDVTAAFAHLLTLADSRFAAPEVFDLLHVAPVREAFGLTETEVGALQGWMQEAGVRWGRTRSHRLAAVGVDFDDYTTWRRGLDRLLLGYAYGSAGGASLPSHLPLPCDLVEGEDAVTLGRFAQFLTRLEALADGCSGRRPAAAWADLLEAAIATFFDSSTANYREVGLLRDAVASLRGSAAAAQFVDAIGIDAARDFLAARLRDVVGGDDLGANAVVFSALRPGSSVPRRIVCLLGLADGAFPRSDSRPAYDLLRRERRFGDRSVRQEDRLAFLEAVTSARDRLYLSYTGFTAEENQPAPPSVLLVELSDALDRAAGVVPPRHACDPIVHRLQPFHPDYFAPGAGDDAAAPLFSFSTRDCETARALRARPEAPAAANVNHAADVTAAEPAGAVIELESLLRFFRHPVRAYFTETLGVRLDLKTEASLEEQETFTPDSLTDFRIGEAIVAALTADMRADGSRVRRELLERGLLPLGAYGVAWFDTRWRQVATWLANPVTELGMPLVEALRLQRQAVPKPCEIALPDGARLTGPAAVAATPAGLAFALDCRFARDRTRERLASWLRHLFGCAASLRATRILAAKPEPKDDPGKVIAVEFGALPAAEALSRLADYAALYRAGQSAPLPFAMEASTAYAETWHNAAPPATEEERLTLIEQALAKAR
ncbi:MAG: exodeoxyribonuclease V subunit gamma, partial [Kiritimatiellae bacterium]|nr:exodeoxyribonuclease V subunit gamma [Kiritimatiellia bacterium]